MIASDDFLLPQADAAGACFTPSAVASFAPFFAGGALPLPDDSEDAGADGLVGVGTHAVAVALRAAEGLNSFADTASFGRGSVVNEAFGRVAAGFFSGPFEEPLAFPELDFFLAGIFS